MGAGIAGLNDSILIGTGRSQVRMGDHRVSILDGLGATANGSDFGVSGVDGVEGVNHNYSVGSIASRSSSAKSCSSE
jgi:hypothetical protein